MIVKNKKQQEYRLKTGAGGRIPDRIAADIVCRCRDCQGDPAQKPAKDSKRQKAKKSIDKRESR